MPNKLTVLCLSIVACLLPGAITDAAEQDERPNIVLILADDQAYSDFGFMGNKIVHTPNLDQLARESTLYVNGYVPTSVCRPSLATILTGQYPHHHGVFFNHPPPGLKTMQGFTMAEWRAARAQSDRFMCEAATLPRVLAKHGYASFQAGKHWEGDFRNCGFTAGMTLNEPSKEPAYGNRKVRDGIVAHGNGDAGLNIGRDTMQPVFDFIEDHRSQPFLLWYAPFIPHGPFDGPAHYRKPFENRPDVPENMVGYYGEITRLDDTVGELLRFIDELKLTRSTVFVFAVDNGFRPTAKRNSDGKFEGPDNRSKLSPYENGVRTPIIIHWAGHTKPAVHTELVQSIDIMPTVLAAAGLPEEARDLPGINLLPSATGETALPVRPAFGEIYPNDARELDDPAREVSYVWVRDGTLKLIEACHGGDVATANRKAAPSVQLFDLATDPNEQNNLAELPDRKADVQRLQALLKQWWPAACESRENAETKKD